MYIPSPDTDLSTLTVEELEALKTLLLSELVISKARQEHIQALLDKVNQQLGP